MRLHLCGVRGSTPAPGADFLRYGGHTSCVAIAHDDAARPTLVLDAGTGLRQVTPLLGGQPFDGTILLTHLHWDHVHGLPFFTGGDRDDARVSLLLPEQEDGASAEQALAKGMSPPHFPIGPGGPARRLDLRHRARPGPLKAEGFTVEARRIPHKGGATYGYRVSDGHRVITYMPDHCPTALGPGPGGLGRVPPGRAGPGRRRRPADPRRVPAAPRRSPPRRSFGHAAADYAIGLGQRAGARRVAADPPQAGPHRRRARRAGPRSPPARAGTAPEVTRGRRGRDTRAMSSCSAAAAGRRRSSSAPARTGWPRPSRWPGRASRVQRHRGRGHARRRLPDRGADPARVPARRLLGGPPAGRRLAVLHRHRPGRPRGQAADPEGRLRPPAGRRPCRGRWRARSTRPPASLGPDARRLPAAARPAGAGHCR